MIHSIVSMIPRREKAFFHLTHVWSTPRGTIHEVCTDSRKKMAVCDESVTVGLPRPFQWWVFVAPTQWRNSCANDALFVWLMCDCTPIYYIDEAYADSQKKMAVCNESIMWSAYYGFFRREFLWSPHNDEILAQIMPFCASHVWLYSWIYYRWGLYCKPKGNGRICPERHGRPLRPFGRWVFVPATQWQNSCASDALFVWLMLYHTLRYTTDEVCIDS
jgi:hypothetical protein